MGTNNTKYEKDKINIKKRVIKKIKFIPEIKINIDHEKRINSVWPISGCKIRKNTTPRVAKKESEYFR